MFIYAHTVDRGNLEFTGEAQQISNMNDFEYVFTYSGDYLPDRSLVKVSIVQKLGDKIIHADGDKDDDYVLERDATGKYILTVDLKFEEFETSTADFDLYCFYTSVVTGNQIEMSFSGFKATFIKP
ncbi:MAG: hypothetical protein MJ219_02755 [Mycoplasmoidaceae bacterium]|nr:hypothetical protein [Mycoplasmoidaceae bacterium]